MNIANEETQDKIRNAFLGLIREKGYSKTTFKEVASASGMTRQNLYYYYESKENMLEDLIEEFFASLYSKMVSYKLDPEIKDDQTLSEALVCDLTEALKNDMHIAHCFYSADVEKIYIKKQVAFLKRMLGAIIRYEEIIVKEPEHIHYIALQMAGAIHYPLKEWITHGAQMPIETFVKLGYPMIDAGVQTLLES